MIQHIVLLKWKEGTTDAEIEHRFAQAKELVKGIDSVERVTLGRNRVEADHGFTHAFIVKLSDDDALSTFLDHPLRQWYFTEVINPIEEARIEIDVPEDAGYQRQHGGSLNWHWGSTRHSASADAAALRWEERHEDF